MKTTKNKTMMEKSLKLADLYTQSQEDKNQEEVQFNLESAKLQLQADILATQKSLAEGRAEYRRLLTVIPFNPSAIINASNNVKALEAGLEELNKLNDLF
jgi:hypothetical protein